MFHVHEIKQYKELATSEALKEMELSPRPSNPNKVVMNHKTHYNQFTALAAVKLTKMLNDHLKNQINEEIPF